MTELAFTGERFIPNLGGEIELEHMSRYLFARDLVKGMKVLDIASGEGYGSAILAQKASEVTGVEISEEVVDFSKKKYADINNLTLLQGSCLNIPCENGIFDIVISFETLEHIKEQAVFLSEIKRVLKPQGILIISTPNTDEYSKDGYQNEYHELELNEEEFKALLEKNFDDVSYFSQNTGYVSYLLPANLPADRTIDSLVNLPNDFAAKYLIAVCKPASSNNIEEKGIVYIDSKINLTEELHIGYKEHLKNWEKVADDLRAEMSDIHKNYKKYIAELEAKVKGVTYEEENGTGFFSAVKKIFK